MRALQLTLLLAGCAVGPAFEAPKAPATDRYLSEAAPTLAALARSPDLQAAEAALRSARAAVLAQRGAFFPKVEAGLSPTRQSVAGTFASPLDSNGYISDLHTTQLTIGQTPDVFGLNRRQVESLTAQADAQRTAAQDMIAAAGLQLDLFRRGQELGQFGAADVAAQQIDLVAVLTGHLPSAAQPSTMALQLPTELPLSQPSHLVEQRPDIRAATEQLHAAGARIGVAIANRLPTRTLTAGGGSAALRFANLFAASTGFWSLGTNRTQPLFDGGALLHRERAARANDDQAAAQYRRTVLLAFGNVADTLGAIEADRRTLVTALASERAARLSHDVSDAQRNAGWSGCRR